MEDRWLTEAVSNNAAWCDAIAASHNLFTSWSESVWWCDQPMPPLYPNIVTLNRGVEIDDTIHGIGSGMSVGWGIKDSYKELDYERLGFSIAFEAQWYCQTPSRTVTDEKNPGTHVETVSNPAELNQWVAAWGGPADIFKSALLENDAVELVYIVLNGKVVSGLATNHSGDSIGISNAFGKAAGILDCIACVSTRNPSKAIVGYGSHTEVAGLSTVGFQAIGDLQIWLRN